MPQLKFTFFIFSFICFSISVNAQISTVINEMEMTHKACISIKPDSNACSKTYLSQMDSMLNVVFEKVINQTDASDKSKIINDQISWGKKKNDFFKKQDETFVYNLKDGIWTKEMIRISYQQKADYLLKRIRVLLKKLKE